MKDYDDFSPLNEVWAKHSEQIEKSAKAYYFSNDKRDFEELIWPDELYVGETELDDVEMFVKERTYEMLEIIKSLRGIPPDMLSSYILRTLIAGMVWEKERIGN